MYIKYYRLTMVSHCVAKEVQRNAKWGCFYVGKESGRVGRRKWVRWKS